MSKAAETRPAFALGDLVETVKGAKYWGRIIAFDDDAERPGCTVLAIDPGFAGTKHVYPLAQLAPSSRETLPADVESLRSRLLDAIRERDVAREHDCRLMSAMGVGDGSGDLFVYGRGEAIRAARQIVDDLARTMGDLRRERRANEEATLRLDDERKALKARVALLEQALRWCRPRLSKDVYREQLDRTVSLPPAEARDDPPVVASSAAETLQANDAVWAAFYRDEKTLGQIAEELGVSIYALSPWLTAPIVRSGLALAEPGLRGAISVAARAHEGQVDKAGRPYLAHPLRMVARALADCDDPDVAIVAALHDVVEDSAITLDDLRGIGFSERVLDAIESLTRRAGEPYRDFLLRLRPNGLAKTVKLFDIADNVDPMRLALISEAKTRERLAIKYAIARSLLAVGA